MSTSLHAQGIRPPDERWQQMKAVYDACKAAGVVVPREVSEFFGGTAPDPSGVVIDLPKRDWQDDYRTGIDVDVADIPQDVKTIRFVVYW